MNLDIISDAIKRASGDYGVTYTDAETKKLQAKIEKIYKKAGEETEKKLKEFEKKFAIKDEKQQAKLSNGEITFDDYKRWMAGQIFQQEQWQNKVDQISKVYTRANSTALDMINSNSFKVFGENANWQSYSLEHGAGVNFGFGLYDAHSVTNLVKNNPQILPKWKVDEPKDYVWSKRKVQSVVTQAIIQGEKLSEVTADLTDKLQTLNKNRMKTFARTAMTCAQNAGRAQSLKDAKGMGIKVMQEWMATFDNHTRSEHRELDGQKVPVGKPFEVDGEKIRYPGDPSAPARLVYNCRCTLVGDLEDYPSEYERYDNIEGKPVKEMTYKEWKQAKTIGGYTKPQTVKKVTKQKEIATPIFESEKLKDALGTEYDGFKQLVNDSDVADVMNDTLSGVDRIMMSQNGGEWDRDKNTLIVCMENYGGRSKYTTVGHECGHAVDWNIGRHSSLSFKEADAINDIWGGTLPPRPSCSDSFLEALRKDMERYDPDKHKMDFLDAIREMKYAVENGDHSTAQVQDVFDGFFSTKDRYLRWGHGDKYYNRLYEARFADGEEKEMLKDVYAELGLNPKKAKETMRQYQAASEAWADLTSASICGGKEMKAIEKFMPNTLAEYRRIIGMVNG